MWRSLDPENRGYRLSMGFLDEAPCLWINVQAHEAVPESEFVSALAGGDVELTKFLMKQPERAVRKTRGAA
jgi:hypothetical protein